MATSAFALNGIDAFYGDSHVLEQVSFSLGEGRLLGLLGRNGAGKSTCMNVTMGLLHPRRGEILIFASLSSVGSRKGQKPWIRSEIWLRTAS